MLMPLPSLARCAHERTRFAGTKLAVAHQHGRQGGDGDEPLLVRRRAANGPPANDCAHAMRHPSVRARRALAGWATPAT